jgi:hypothetical protein
MPRKKVTADAAATISERPTRASKAANKRTHTDSDGEDTPATKKAKDDDNDRDQGTAHDINEIYRRN